MNPVAIAALCAAGVAAAVNWWALVAGRHDVERIAKPLATALLVVVAATAGSPDGIVRAALIVAVLLGLAGDIALLGDSEGRFMAGLGAFAVGHAAYVVAALGVGFSGRYALIGIPIFLGLLLFGFLTRIAPGAWRAGGSVLLVAVLIYGGIISAMVLTAAGTGSILAAVGAIVFAISDYWLGQDRFVEPVPQRDLIVMVPYHVGQALLVLGLATH